MDIIVATLRVVMGALAVGNASMMCRRPGNDIVRYVAMMVATSRGTSVQYCAIVWARVHDDAARWARLIHSLAHQYC